MLSAACLNPSPLREVEFSVWLPLQPGGGVSLRGRARMAGGKIRAVTVVVNISSEGFQPQGPVQTVPPGPPCPGTSAAVTTEGPLASGVAGRLLHAPQRPGCP